MVKDVTGAINARYVFNFIWCTRRLVRLLGQRDDSSRASALEYRVELNWLESRAVGEFE